MAAYLADHPTADRPPTDRRACEIERCVLPPLPDLATRVVVATAVRVS